MPQGFAIEDANSLEIVAAYAAPRTVILAVEESPGWYLAGSFYLPVACAARLDVTGLVSSTGLTLRARLYDMTALAAVSGAQAQITTKYSSRALSGVVELAGGRNYQIQAECTGDVGDDMFGVVLTGTITD